LSIRSSYPSKKSCPSEPDQHNLVVAQIKVNKKHQKQVDPQIWTAKSVTLHFGIPEPATFRSDTPWGVSPSAKDKSHRLPDPGDSYLRAASVRRKPLEDPKRASMKAFGWVPTARKGGGTTGGDALPDLLSAVVAWRGATNKNRKAFGGRQHYSGSGDPRNLPMGNS